MDQIKTGIKLQALDENEEAEHAEVSKITENIYAVSLFDGEGEAIEAYLVKVGSRRLPDPSSEGDDAGRSSTCGGS